MSDLIDSSVVIDAAASYYRVSVCPGFWDWLAVALAEGRVVLMPQVRAELTRADQDLQHWFSDRAMVAEPTINSPIDDAYGRVREAIPEMKCTEPSVRRFLNGADLHLVAHALAGGHRIVSRELREDPKKQYRRLKIPDVCDALDIPCIGTFQMLEEHGVRFVLGE